MENFDLSLIWAVIVSFSVIMYVLMDGFDLGVGILFPFAPDEDARDVMMNSVAPIWDGNETWLVLGGAGLLAAPALAAASLPNIVLLVSDDQGCDDEGWRDFGFMGSGAVRTPH